MSTPVSDIHWSFPLPRTHCGIALGNGTQGVLVWGDGFLCLTVARAGFWDHRGGKEFTPDATFSKVRALLEAEDAEGIKSLFSPSAKPSSNIESHHQTPARPQQIGGGRIELHFADGFKPRRGVLKRESGVLEIEMQNAAGESRLVHIETSMDDEVTWIDGASDAYAATAPVVGMGGRRVGAAGRSASAHNRNRRRHRLRAATARR
jgi:hypothetical protein